jgi:general stress protein YciG
VLRLSGLVLYFVVMSKSVLSKYLAELGRKGGKARLKKMTAEKRAEIARKAGQASAAAKKKRKAQAAKKARAKQRQAQQMNYLIPV